MKCYSSKPLPQPITKAFETVNALNKDNELLQPKMTSYTNICWATLDTDVGWKFRRHSFVREVFKQCICCSFMHECVDLHILRCMSCMYVGM